MSGPFWSDPNIEPKRKNRWLLYIQNFQPFLVASFTKPSITVGKSSYQELNNIRYKPTVAKWEPCNFTVVDVQPIDGKDNLNSTANFLNIIRASGYPVLKEPNLPERDIFGAIKEFSSTDATDYYEKGGEVFSNIIKEKAVNALGRVRFVQLGNGTTNPASSDELEEWTLHNCWIERCDFGGDASYEDDIIKISATICYDYATYSKRKK